MDELSSQERKGGKEGVEKEGEKGEMGLKGSLAGVEASAPCPL